VRTTVVAVATLVPAALLAACLAAEETRGPTYKVEYLLKPPATEDGRRCAASCTKVQAYCQREADAGGVDRHRICEQRASDEYELCVGRTTSVSEKNACYRRACAVGPDYVNCETGFRSCFENCGGEVWSRTVCDTGC
jgi:hypothetical protein